MNLFRNIACLAAVVLSANLGVALQAFAQSGGALRREDQRIKQGEVGQSGQIENQASRPTIGGPMDGTSPRIVTVSPPPGQWVRTVGGLGSLYVTFDEGVVIPSGAVSVWTVTQGVVKNFVSSYDEQSQKLSILFNTPLQSDRVTVVLDYSITDLAGNELDGEVVNPTSPILPSGDGLRGGQAVLRFNVLQGDANRDGVLNDIDRNLILQALGTSSSDPTFSPAADFNNDGHINILDVATFHLAFMSGAALPSTDGATPTILARIPPIGGDAHTLAFGAVEVTFSEPVQVSFANPRSLFVIRSDGELQVAEGLTWTNGNTRATFTFTPPLPADGQYLFRLSNAIRDVSGELLASSPPAGWSATIGAPTRIASSSPYGGEDSVAVTRETIIRFQYPLDPASIDASDFTARFAGQTLNTLLHVSPDHRTVTLFYQDPLPASARVRVAVSGSGLLDDLGRAVDVDGNGEFGGTERIDFDTLTLTTLPGTAVCGRVFASELGDGGVNTPLEGVTITVDGREFELFAITDSKGNFRIEPAPVGKFFVHVDGRTAVNPAPPGAYYPFVGKAWDSRAGEETNIGNVYLPLVPPDTLQPVSETQDTVITFPPAVLAAHPELQGVTVTVPADSLYADDGTRGGMVGIAPVAPDRMPGQLPPNLQFPIVLSVQTDGATNFDKPVSVCFPNLPDPILGVPLPPGEKNFLFSFNHDTGQFEAAGGMTVTSNGQLICTDDGVGIPAPGWHGSGPPPLGPMPPCAGSARGSDDGCSDDDGDGWSDDDTFEGVVDEFTEAQDACQPICDAASNADIDDPNYPKYLVQCEQCANGWRACSTRLGETGADVPGTSTNPGVPGLLDTIGRAISDIIDFFFDRSLRDTARADDLFTFQILSGSGVQVFAIIPLTVFETSLHVTLSEAPTIPLMAGRAHYINDLSELGIFSPTGVFISIESVLTDRQFVARLTLVSLDNMSDTFAQSLAGHLTNNEPPHPVRYAAQVRSGKSAFAVRGETRPYGEYELFLPRNATIDRLSFCDIEAGTFGLITPKGGVTELPRVTLIPIDNGFADSDSDNLADLVEQVVGTDMFEDDSDDDGIPDGAEIQQGTDPLDGVVAPTGLIASADTPGSAADVCAVNDLAVVADSSAGVSVFNVFNGMDPTIIAQVDTPGTASAVACAGDLVAVADGSAGLAIIDITDPPAAQITHQLNLGSNVVAVAAAGPIAYAGLQNGGIVVVDMPTGAILQQTSVGTTIQDLAIEKETLYALTVGTLHALPLGTGTLAVGGSATSPGIQGGGGRRLRLSVGGGIAYAIHTQGYNTFDLSNPIAPVLIESGLTAQFGWKQLVPNGSGLGVAAVGANSPNDGPHEVSLYDLSDPSDTDVFLTQFVTPGLAAAVSIFNGLAYVADSEAGLQVVNYLSYDNLGVPPIVNLSTNYPMGLAEEGKLLRVSADVADDVQVRNVEFYVDGAKVFTDGNFPFEYRFVAPSISQQTSLSVQARASDTGGNAAWSAVQTIMLTTDATPPTVVDVSPLEGTCSESVPAISAIFNEPVDPLTITNTSFQLFSCGPDSLPGTMDDVPVVGAASYRVEINAAVFTPTAQVPGDRYRGVARSTIADLAGNELGADYSWIFAIPGTPYCVPAPSGISGWWPGDGDAMGLTVGLDGSLAGDVSFTPATVDEGFFFNGVSGCTCTNPHVPLGTCACGYVQVPDHTALRTTTSVSLAFWAKRDSVSDFYVVLEKGGDWTHSRLNYGVSFQPGRIYFLYAGGYRAANTPSDTEWHHYVIVASHGDTNPVFYVDGAVRPVVDAGGNTSLATINFPDPPSTQPLHIGAQIDSPIGGETQWNYWSDGLRLDEVQIYTRGLSESEVQSIFCAGSAGNCRP